MKYLRAWFHSLFPRAHTRWYHCSHYFHQPLPRPVLHARKPSCLYSPFMLLAVGPALPLKSCAARTRCSAACGLDPPPRGGRGAARKVGPQTRLRSSLPGSERTLRSRGAESVHRAESGQWGQTPRSCLPRVGRAQDREEVERGIEGTRADKPLQRRGFLSFPLTLWSLWERLQCGNSCWQ